MDKIYFYAMEPQISTVHLIIKISNWSLFKLIFSDQALITLELFLLRYVPFNGQKLSGLPKKNVSQSTFILC